jgi:hypothetical protein
LVNVEAGSPYARAHQSILGAKLNFLSLFCDAKIQKLFSLIVFFICYHIVGIEL